MVALERINHRGSSILEYAGIRIQSMVDRFLTSECQVRRNLAYMRYRLKVPFKYVRDQIPHEYTEQSTAAKNIDQKTLLFYVFARAAAETLVDRIWYEPQDFKPLSDDTLFTILASLGGGRRFAVSYRDADRNTTAQRAAALHASLKEGIQNMNEVYMK